jgi:predicted DNA-binding transcriptional regulator AlpA
MTLQESERRRRQSDGDTAAKLTRRRDQQARKQALRQPSENAVLTFREWCALNGFSRATGMRVINAGEGPIVTQLGKRRIGVTVGNNARWQESRARGA